MKLGTLKIPPAGRVAAFIFGAVSAWVTLRDISRGFTRYGGVVNTRADEPFRYWSVVATMTYITVLLFCAAFVRRKTDA
jgi:hypothetical protein